MARDREKRNAYQRRYRRAKGMKERVLLPKRLCQRCGNVVPPANRRFCSMACCLTAQTEDREAAFVSNTLNPGDGSGLGRVPRWVRAWWIARYGECCALCGWAQPHPRTGRIPLEFDHIDGDCSNNRHSNLRLLCPNCHALSENHAVLNYGKSKRRRKWAGVVIIQRVTRDA